VSIRFNNGVAGERRQEERMRYPLLYSVFLLLFVVIISGCTTLTPTPSPAETATSSFMVSTVVPEIREPSSTPDQDTPEDVYYEVHQFPYLPIRWGLWWNDGALIDFDSDDDLDLLVIHVDADDWEPTPAWVLENDGTGRFLDTTRSMYPEQEVYSYGVNVIKIADFNGDGRDDAYFIDQGRDAPPWGGNVNTLLIQTPDGLLDDQTEARIPNIRNFTHDATVADVDGDGDIDIYNCNVYGGEGGATLYINDGDGYFTDGSSQIPAVLRTLERKFTSSEFADVDNDGDMDLVLGSHGGGLPSEISARDTILINDGAGNFQFGNEAALPERLGGPTWGVSEMATGDLDGDGWTDLVMCVHRNYQNTNLQVLINNQDGTFRDATDWLPQDALSRVFRIDMHDLNGDGLLDIVVASDAQFKLYFNTGGAQFIDATHILPVERTDLRPILPGDLDGDGDVDLLMLTLDSHFYIAFNVKQFEFSTNE
jgi:hypothetical protein